MKIAKIILGTLIFIGTPHIYADCPSAENIKNNKAKFITDKDGTKWVFSDGENINKKIKSGLKFFYAAGTSVNLDKSETPLPRLVLYHFECGYTTKNLIPDAINDKENNLILKAEPNIIAYEIPNPEHISGKQGVWKLDETTLNTGLYTGLARYWCLSVPKDNNVTDCSFNLSSTQKGYHLYGGSDRVNDSKGSS